MRRMLSRCWARTAIGHPEQRAELSAWRELLALLEAWLLRAQHSSREQDVCKITFCSATRTTIAMARL